MAVVVDYFDGATTTSQSFSLDLSRSTAVDLEYMCVYSTVVVTIAGVFEFSHGLASSFIKEQNNDDDRQANEHTVNKYKRKPQSYHWCIEEDRSYCTY